MNPHQFRKLAAYNRWANARLYSAALDLSDQGYRLKIDVAFDSLHGTLNHLLLADRLWLKRLTGEGEHPNQPNAILYDDLVELTRARIAEDHRLIAVVDKYDEASLASPHSYRATTGMPQSQVLADILMHLFNHQRIGRFANEGRDRVPGPCRLGTARAAGSETRMLIARAIS